jgi:murein DD-endopeptidase MepM/ murein hydrolase activator NlpD
MRNHYKTKIKIGLIALAFMVVGGSFSPARAQTDNDAKKKSLQEQLARLQAEIRSLQGTLSSNRKQQASLKNEIGLYDNQIRTTELEIQAKETQIEDAKLQIEELGAQIERRIAEIEDNKKVLGSLIAELYKLGGSSLIQLGLGNDNFSDFLDQLQYTESVQGKVYSIVQNIKVVKKKLEEQKADLEIQLSKLEQLKEQLDQTKSSLETQRKGKEALLAQTRNSENRYQQVLSASNKEASDLQKEINDLDAAVRAKLGNRSISGSGTLAKPLDGVLTQRYGNTGFTALGYNFHNGVDIAGPCGTPVYASADETVNNTRSGERAYGNWITIKHTIAAKGGSRQIVTLYGHLRTIKIKNGQSVKRGDLIGYEGNTGNTTRLLYGPERGCHVHFTVFDAEGFGVAKGANVKAYGTYYVPYGYTYDPFTFF